MDGQHYLEYQIPDWLAKSIRQYEDNKNSSLWDCYYCELQSDINVCETENLITPEQAWHLRETYLGLSKGDNGGRYYD